MRDQTQTGGIITFVENNDEIPQSNTLQDDSIHQIPIEDSSKVDTVENSPHDVTDHTKETTPVVTPTETEENRGKWGSRLSFIITTVGAAVGFGNFLRFPYLVYQHGGGAFLIPYILAIIFLGDKIMLLELSLGQMTQKTALMAFHSLSPRALGIGASAVFFGSFMIGVYYCVIVSWSIVFFFYCFENPLPWADDPQKFFFDVVLTRSTWLWDFSGISWKVLLALFFLWVCIFFSIWKGVKSLSIVSYFTVPLPFIVLTGFLIRGFFLEGSWTGVYYYLYPDFSKLLTVEIWLAAIGQVFFSLSLASGIMTGYSSFNKKKQNVAQDTVIISIIDASFSIFSGFVIFQVLGYMAHVKGVTIDKVTSSGIGLAFVAFPDALSTMPWANLFALFFFVTLFSLGLSSAFSLVEAVTGNLRDAFPNVGSVWIPLITCIIGFCLGIPFTLSNGFYFIDILDHFTSDYCLVGIGMIEAALVGWLIASTSFFGKFRQITSTGWAKAKQVIWILVFHSVEEYREKIIKEITPPQGRSWFDKLIGPHIDWSLSIKFLVPVLLGVLLAVNIVNEFLNPYGFAQHGYSSLLFGIVPLACFGTILAGAIFGDFSMCRKKQQVEEIAQEKPLEVKVESQEGKNVGSVGESGELIDSIRENQEKISTMNFE